MKLRVVRCGRCGTVFSIVWLILMMLAGSHSLTPEWSRHMLSSAQHQVTNKKYLSLTSMLWLVKYFYQQDYCGSCMCTSATFACKVSDFISLSLCWQLHVEKYFEKFLRRCCCAVNIIWCCKKVLGVACICRAAMNNDLWYTWKLWISSHAHWFSSYWFRFVKILQCTVHDALATK